MAIDNNNLRYLVDPFWQGEGINGKPLVAGWVCVYYAGTDVKVITKQNFDGVDNPFKIPLNNDGRAVILVPGGAKYDAYVYDSFGNLAFSRLNITPVGDNGGDISGLAQIFHDDTLTGDGSYHDPLGAIEYTGILPIDVNNDLHLISAQTTRLGVQEPLYFVQDDDEMTVIGLSGGIVPEGTMNESAFGYEDGQITSYNGSAFSAGNTYEAGSYIDITNNTIGVTGLTPVPADTASTGLVASVSADITAMIPDTSDMATKSWVNEQGFLTAHQDLSDYAKTEDLTAYYPASNPDGFINSDAISAMATTGLVADVSGDITALIPSTAGLATEDWVSSQGYLTAHQSLDGLMSADLLEISDNKITGYNGTAFAGQGGGVTGDFTLVEGNGIQLTDDPTAQTTTISVSGDYATNTQLQTVSADITAMIPTALTGDYLDKASADTLYYPLNSNPNNYLTTAYTPEFAYHDTAISGIDNSALYDNSAHARINTLAGRISDLSSNKLDTTAFSDVSGTFLTAHQDLSDYQTTAGMTAYQSAGDYLTTADSGNFLTAVPDTYLQNTDLSTADGKVTAISGIPLSAGGDVPEGVMVESGLEYNAVDEISGYNGSAFAQYGAEKQWLVTDDTMVHLSNSSQYALGVNLSAVAQLLGVDETVLFFAGNESSGVQSGNLTESIKNFKRIRVAGMDNDGHTDVKYIYPAWTKNADGFSTTGYEVMLYGANPYAPQSTIWEKWTRYSFSALTSFNVVLSYEGSYTANSVNNVTNNHKNSIREVVGIGRING